MLDDFRRRTACLADFLVSGIVFELQREEFKGEGFKFSVPGRVGALRRPDAAARRPYPG